MQPPLSTLGAGLRRFNGSQTTARPRKHMATRHAGPLHKVDGVKSPQQGHQCSRSQSLKGASGFATRAVVSDNGRQFIGKEFSQLLEDYKIEHRRTPPYTPSGAYRQATEDCYKSIPGEIPKEMRPVSFRSYFYL